MSHQHHDHAHDYTSSRALLVAFALNAGFTVLEIVGGLLINSVAVLSDAVHDLGDSFALGLAWFLNRYSEKDSNARYSYGYRRFSLLGALINTTVLIAGGVLVLSEAIPRLFDPEPFNARGMVAFAVIGVLANGAAAWSLRGGQSANVQVVGWHLLEDVLGWVAVLIVGLISLVVDLPVLDPLLSIAITAFILYNVIGKLQNTVKLFLQAVPESIDLDEIERRITAVDGVEALHHTHLWSLDGEHHVFSTHVLVPADMPKTEALCIKQAARAALRDLDLAHVTIEIEYGDEDCSMG